MASKKDFRFYDNRQKYLLFVNTCSEKLEIANVVQREFQHIRPSPPAIRLFDAGMGDGTVLTRVLRSMHKEFPTIPFYVVGKEISMEDVRLCLEKIPDRMMEHPMTVFVATNLYYFQAPWLSLMGKADDMKINWVVVELEGQYSHEFAEQIGKIQKEIAEKWQASASPKSGNPIYVTPTVLVIYRKDQRFVLDHVIPQRGENHAEFDLIVASQPYRARTAHSFKVRNVIAPLTSALGPGGRLVAIHSYGNDPGMEIIHEVWPDAHPFRTDRHKIWNELKSKFPDIAQGCALVDENPENAIFKYEMYMLPDEISGQQSAIGTSTVLAAWNAAIYVAQIDEDRLEQAITEGSYIKATRRILAEHSGLWFQNECYTVVRV